MIPQELEPLYRLAGAVFEQAVDDANGVMPRSTHENIPLVRYAAQQWLTREARDSVWMQFFAEPDVIVAALRDRIVEPVPQPVRPARVKAVPPPPEPRPRKTHCKHGHEYTVENTYTRNDGSRECRICQRVGWRRTHAGKAA